MDKMESHMLLQEASNRQEQIIRGLREAEKDARELIEMLQVLTSPNERQKKLTDEQRTRERAYALDRISSGTRSYNAAYLGTLASEMRAMIDTHHAFTERLWEK